MKKTYFEYLDEVSAKRIEEAKAAAVAPEAAATDAPPAEAPPEVAPEKK